MKSSTQYELVGTERCRSGHTVASEGQPPLKNLDLTRRSLFHVRLSIKSKFPYISVNLGDPVIITPNLAICHWDELSSASDYLQFKTC
ncbi:hypothetical protein L1887_38401 [Cichorium endivia]|nr:hypothetical protein L1887_38401 [Cichorium endivia]